MRIIAVRTVDAPHAYAQETLADALVAAWQPRDAVASRSMTNRLSAGKKNAPMAGAYRYRNVFRGFRM
jgi:hypothetical protein